MLLAGTVTENDDVSPICVTSLPTSDFFNQECVVTGWGTTSEGKYKLVIYSKELLTFVQTIKSKIFLW